MNSEQQSLSTTAAIFGSLGWLLYPGLSVSFYCNIAILSSKMSCVRRTFINLSILVDISVSWIDLVQKVKRRWSNFPATQSSSHDVDSRVNPDRREGTLLKEQVRKEQCFLWDWSLDRYWSIVKKLITQFLVKQIWF